MAGRSASNQHKPLNGFCSSVTKRYSVSEQSMNTFIFIQHWFRADVTQNATTSQMLQRCTQLDTFDGVRNGLCG
jgi:hypothetical protein